MIKRYRNTGALIYIVTQVATNTLASSTASTATYNTTISGEPGSVVGFKVTTYSHSNGGAAYTVDGVTYVLNDTFTRTLDGSGNASFVQFIDVGTTTPSNAINVVLTIETTSIGPVSGLVNNTNISKTT